MLEMEQLIEARPPLKPISLTIGTFDGVHLGHQAVINRTKMLAAHNAGSSAVLTFSNHPSQILSPQQTVKTLCTVDHKFHLLKKMGINRLFILPFSEKIANLSAEEFIKEVQSHYHFSHLVLGHDASFGKNREGDYQTLKKLGEKLAFRVEYIPETRAFDVVVSSSRIRNLLEQGNLAAVEKLLGRKYSIYGTIIQGAQKGRKIGFPTLNLDLQGLCLPPFGVYAVQVFDQKKWVPGIANLGIAPTLRANLFPQLEVHLLDEQPHSTYNDNIEVQLLSFIRTEKLFSNIQALKQQIEKDILLAKSILSSQQNIF